MKVLFDGYWWDRGPTSNRMVQRQFITAWRRNFPQDDLIVAIPGSRECAEGNSGGITFVRTRLRKQLLINSIELPVIARSRSADCIVAHNFAPIWGKSVVFIHDVLFMENPEWFSKAELAYFGYMPRLARFADTVALSTETERERFKNNVAYSGRTVRTGLDVADELLLIDDSEPQHLNLESGSFALVVGRLNKRKNLARTVRACIRSGAAKKEHPLVIVGEGDGAEVIDELEIADSVADGSVKFAGFVELGQLKWLYMNCSYTACLSLGEGFGLTPVEARRFGSPLIVSDIPVFRENLTGNDVTFVDPLAEAEIESGLRAVTAEGKRRSAAPPDEKSAWDSAVATLRTEALVAVSGGEES